MSNRQRMTWAALEREAAAAPATPGYGVGDQDHPAHTQDDPDKDKYNIGGPSEFAEDVHPPPYGDSGSPATPGYGVEDQDHPAHKGQVGRQASLMELVRKKSAKALVLARATLGKTAAWGDVEDQAFDYMRSMDDSSLDASLGRLGGDFLGMEDEFLGMDDEFLGMDDEFLGMDDMIEEPMDDMGMDPMEARLKAMEDELAGYRAAAQNDPAGETLGTSGKSEGEEKKEEEVVSDKAASAVKLAKLAPVLAMFDAYDTDSDGFVVAEEWGGPRSMFAALDADKDGIIARADILASDDDDDDDEDDEVEAGKKASDDKASDDKDEGTDKKAFGHYADFDEDELEMLQAMDFNMEEGIEDEGPMGCGDVMASDKSEDEDIELDEETKEASEANFFAPGHDPMGLADGTALTAEDEAAFKLAFGDDEEDDDKDEGSDKEASLDSLLAPQPRTSSMGVQSVGSVPATRTASGKSNEIDELSNLWASKPDVSAAFGG